MLTQHPHPIKPINTAPKKYASARLAEVWLTRQCQRASLMVVPTRNEHGIFFDIRINRFGLIASWFIGSNGYGVVDMKKPVGHIVGDYEPAIPYPRHFEGLSVATAQHILAHNQPEHVKAEALRVFDWVTETNVGGIKPYTFAVYEAAKPTSFYDWFNFYMQEGNYAIARRMIEGLQLAYPDYVIAHNLIDNIPTLRGIHKDALDWWGGYIYHQMSLENEFMAVYGTGALWLWTMLLNKHWKDALDMEVKEYE